MQKKLASVALVAASLVLVAAPAAADLCPKCKGKMYITNVGKCVECGGATRSGAFKLCKKCSAKLGQCEHCRAPLKKATPPPNAVVLTEDANGRTATVEVGKLVIVRLKGNPTTGYSWTVRKVDGKALEQVGKVKYVARKVPKGIVGSGGTFIATFRAVKPGKATPTLVYARPWEKKKPPARTFKVTIEVKRAAKPPAPRARPS